MASGRSRIQELKISGIVGHKYRGEKGSFASEKVLEFTVSFEGRGEADNKAVSLYEVYNQDPQLIADYIKKLATRSRNTLLLRYPYLKKLL